MTAIDNRMLVLARESRGLTQKQLVDKIDNLNQGNYSKMEKGLLKVPNDTLLGIAKVLDYKPGFFNKKSVSTPISSFYYRKRLTIGKKELSLLESQLDIIRIAIDDLFDSVEVPLFDLPKYQVTSKLSASDIAIRIREFLKVPKGTIRNLVRILERAGIVVYFIKANTEKFDGITLITDNGQPVIFINESLSNDRKRYTICHELGHLIMHIPFSPLPQDQDEESEANEFAGEFLMPFLDCRNDLMDLRYSKLGILKSFWGVSKAALIYRAKEIGGITQERFTNLFIELSKNGERKNEVGFVDIDVPTMIDLAIKTHENDYSYSLEQMLQLLSMNESDYFYYFDKSYHLNLVKPKKIIQMYRHIVNE